MGEILLLFRGDRASGGSASIWDRLLVPPPATSNRGDGDYSNISDAPGNPGSTEWRGDEVRPLNAGLGEARSNSDIRAYTSRASSAVFSGVFAVCKEAGQERKAALEAVGRAATKLDAVQSH